MIDYNNLDNYYTGVAIPVVTNVGGILYEFGDSIPTLFYKIDNDQYIDVNNKVIAQVIRDGIPIRENYVVPVQSLSKVKTKQQDINNTSLVKRLTFKPSNYAKKCR